MARTHEVVQIVTRTLPTVITTTTTKLVVKPLEKTQSIEAQSVEPQPAFAKPPVKPKRPKGRSGEAFTTLLVDVALLVAVSFEARSAPPVIAAVVAAAVVAFAVAGLYRARLQFSVLDDLPRLAAALGVVVAVGGWVVWTNRWTPHGFASRSVLWGAAMLGAVAVGRVVVYRVLRRHRRRRPGRATIVVGSGALALQLVEAMRADSTYGLAPVGFVGPPTLTRPAVPVLAPLSQLERAVARYKPLQLIVAFPATPDADLVSTLRRCRRYGATVHVVPRLFELSAWRGTDTIRCIPLVRLRGDPAMTRRWAVKRIIDIVGATIGLVLLSPVLLLCALAVRLESRRHGVLFRQERVSVDEKPFTIMKFRSLTPTSELESQLKWNINNDARLGKVGKFLRFSSLDELPQLLNVLRGDMSLVGPRPERPFFVEQFRRQYAGYSDRHRVPAGLTGWAQIHGLRGDTSIEERVRFDNHYIEHWSLAMDVKIILRTVGAMLSVHRV